MNRVVVFVALLILSVTRVAGAELITKLTLVSPIGDYIGQGQSITRTPLDGHFQIDQDVQGQNGISVRYHNTDYTEWWDLHFAAPNLAALAVGSYPDAERFTLQAADHSGLSVDGDGRGCNTLSGSFEVKYIAYNSDGAVLSLWITFSQSCEGMMPPLTGEIMFQLDRTVAAMPTSWGKLKALYR